MNEELKRKKERIDQNNTIVRWIENFKGFLTKLVQEAIGILKKNTYKVEVENQIEMPDEIAISNMDEINSVLIKMIKAIEAKKEFEATDLSKLEGQFEQMLTCIKALPTDFPKQDDTNVVQAIKTLEERFSSLIKAIGDMPVPKATDMTKVEQMLSAMSRSFNAYYDGELAEKKKREMEMKKIEKKIESAPCPTLLEEGDIEDEDGDVVEMYEKWSDGRIVRDIADIKYRNGKKYINWRHDANSAV